MHKLLERQLRRLLGLEVGAEKSAVRVLAEDGSAIGELLELVSKTYEEADRDRGMLERSLDLSSQEMLERNKRLKADIKRRKEIEVALRASEGRVQFHLQHTPLGIVEWDANGKITEWNHAAQRIFGYTAAEMIGTTGNGAIIAPATEDEPLEGMQDRMPPSEWMSRQFTLNRSRRRDGTTIYCEWYVTQLLDDAGALIGTAAIVHDVTQRVGYEQELLRLTREDSLTGLANRRHFIDALSRAIARTVRNPTYLFAVIFIDIDRFKLINDTLGHLAGDRYLQRLADALATQIRGNDQLARLGGDEFAVLLDDIRSEEHALQAAERISRAASAPVDLGNGKTVSCQASAGVALSSVSYQSAEDVLRNADLALYRAKRQGGGRFVVFDEAMQSHALERLELQAELVGTVDRRQFHLRYQPIVDLETGRMVACEAMPFWEHPKRGLIAPEEVVSLAEEVGGMGEIDRWAVAEVCQQLGKWADELEPDFFVTLDVSPAALLEDKLPRMVLGLLEHNGMKPSRLGVELQDLGRMADLERVRSNLTTLRKSGVKVILDGFGARFASLGSLHDLEVDLVKIEPTFVQGLHRASSISDLILLMAERLGTGTVANGVDSPKQVKLLVKRGCALGQGKLFGEPLPTDDFSERLRSHA